MLLLWPITLSKKLLILTAAKKFYLCDPFLEEFSSLLEFENQPNLVDWASSNENLIAISLVSGL